ASEIETITENHLCNQMVRGARYAYSQPEVDLPFGGKVQVNGGKNLLLLLVDGVKARHRTQRTVVFQAARKFLGEIVAEFKIGRKYQPLIHARSVKRPVKCGIEGEIPAAELLIRDRTDFPRPGVRGVPPALPANFIREADADGPMPFWGNPHSRPDVAANVIPTLAVLC